MNELRSSTGRHGAVSPLELVLTVVLLLRGLSACSGEVPRAPEKPALAVHTDVARLRRRHLKLPTEVRAARWLVVPRGVQGGLAPGPTDTILYAFLDLDARGWAAVQPLLSTPRVSRVDIPADVVAALELRLDGVDAGLEKRSEVEVYEADVLAPRYVAGAGAIKLRGGLLVWAGSM